jgi:coenzyme F420 hydrogenase subunit beta
MTGVLHVRAKGDNPLVNIPFFSTNKADLLCRAGSRYSPGAPCAGLRLAEASGSECVFVGKPCEVAGLRKLHSVNAKVAKKFGLTISLFCAGTPATVGTEKVLQRLCVNPTEVSGLEYRGEGWPGKFRVKLREAGDERREMSYDEC